MSDHESDHESEDEDKVKGITTQIGVDAGMVVLRWDRAIAWLALTPETADKFADEIKRHAQAARNLIN